MRARHLCVLIGIWAGVGLAPWSWFRPSGEIFLLTVPRRYFFCGSFMLFQVCVCCVSCASVYCCLVDACWERADLLALVCGVLL